MTMVEVKTAGLIGQALDWATGVADGLDIVVIPNFKKPGHRVLLATPFTIERPGHPTFHDKSYRNWLPSIDWSQGGPLIEKYRVSIWTQVSGLGKFGAMVMISSPPLLPLPCTMGGETYLIAACRAIVAAKLGDTVQVPEELI